MKRLLQRWADNTNPNSLASRLRRKRFALFLHLLDKNPKHPLQILDVGGTENFWEVMEFADSDYTITLFNLTKFECKRKNMHSIVGDARNMSQFKDKQFDIVFSNSVIEHLGTLQDQAKMANEIRRVSNAFFVQTPNFYFPLEPHFLFPFFHCLPKSARIWLISNFSLGWVKKSSNPEEASRLVTEIRLMTKSEIQSLFPDARIVRERFLGFTKSLIALKS